MTGSELLLVPLLLGVAALYSSVGHAGASGYIAAMTLLNMAPDQIRPAALTLNLLVGGIGLIRFSRHGHVKVPNVVPFVITSAPAAFLAARVTLSVDRFEALLGVILLVAAAGIFWRASQADEEDQSAANRRVPRIPAAVSGAAIGTLSGLTGTGGAIFLSPLLLFNRWLPTREVSGTAVAFVWINSLTALAGLLSTTGDLPRALPLWLLAVALGTVVGTQLGLSWLDPTMLRRLLGFVLIIAALKLLAT